MVTNKLITAISVHLCVQHLQAAVKHEHQLDCYLFSMIRDLSLLELLYDCLLFRCAFSFGCCREYFCYWLWSYHYSLRWISLCTFSCDYPAHKHKHTHAHWQRKFDIMTKKSHCAKMATKWIQSHCGVFANSDQMKMIAQSTCLHQNGNTKCLFSWLTTEIQNPIQSKTFSVQRNIQFVWCRYRKYIFSELLEVINTSNLCDSCVNQFLTGALDSCQKLQFSHFFAFPICTCNLLGKMEIFCWKSRNQ